MTNREAGINVIRSGDPGGRKLWVLPPQTPFQRPMAFPYAVDRSSRCGIIRLAQRSTSCWFGMSVMIAMRQPHETAIHMAARGSITALHLKEIEELASRRCPYVGYPAIATARWLL